MLMLAEEKDKKITKEELQIALSVIRAGTAFIRYQINTAKGILETILQMQPKEGGGQGGGETREAVVSRLAHDMLAKLPHEYNQHE
ncbi:Dynein heavy chain 8, axonemal, partial [Halocaridina rubra]